MPLQLAAVPLNIDWQQVLLHVLNFVILFAGLWLLLYKPVRSFMQKRREHYEKMDADANAKNAAAEEKKAAYEQKLAAADAEAEEKRRAAERAAADYEAEKRAEADAFAKQVVSDARRDAVQIKAQAVSEARGEIADIVSEAVGKVVLEDSTSEAYDQFLDAASAPAEK